MFDSTAKIPDGVLIGNSKILGQYDECVDVEDPEINFVGQHCMMNIKLKLGLGSLKTYKKEHWSQVSVRTRYFLRFQFLSTYLYLK